MENTKFINVYIFDKNINVFKLSDEEGKTDWHKSSPGNIDDDKKHQTEKETINDNKWTRYVYKDGSYRIWKNGEEQ